jgi:uncharacterized membrane protein
MISIVLTIAYHVPRNNLLASVDPNGVDSVRHWAAYSPAWTAWNHVRTISSIAAAALLTIGLRIGQHV